jgi:phosphinothricin acetyltransferase
MDSRHVGKGIGTQLLKELLERLKAVSLHSVISGIALPNPASVALCERFGFKKIAHFSEVGYKMNRWIDVGYWELLL